MKSKTKSRAGLTVLICILVLTGFAATMWMLGADTRKFNTGKALMESGQYSEAILIFETLSENPEANSLIPVCHYKQAESYRLAGDYAAAQASYEQAGDYRDAATQAQRMLYNQGHQAFLQEDYDAANRYFLQLEGSLEDYGYYHFETLADAARYLDQQRSDLADTVRFHIGDVSDEDFSDNLRNLFPSLYYLINYFEKDKLLTIAGIEYYPADNILYALKINDTSRLTDEELEVLDLAQQVVAQAKEETSTLFETELWIHDWLCNQVDYESPNMEVKRKEYIRLRELSSVGAMLDGIANCQGYADAFYLLGTMAGLEVDRVFGTAGGGHIWNTVNLDGQNYIVDVTFDDYSDPDFNGWGYTYFNAYWDPNCYDPYGDDSLNPEVTKEQDLSQSYFLHKNLIFSTLEDAAESLIQQHLTEGHSWAYALVTEAEISMEELNDTLYNKLWKYAQYGRSYSWSYMADPYGGNTALIVHWT